MSRFAAMSLILGATMVGTAMAETCVLPSYAHLRDKIAAGEDITVVYLGGSITMGAMTYPPQGTNRDGEPYDYRGRNNPDQHSWRALSFAWLKENFEQRPGQFRMVNAAVGATNSELAAYRLDEHVLSQGPDLLFVEFAINDNGVGLLSDEAEAGQSIYRTMSSIVSRARAANPDLAVFIPVSTARDLDPSKHAGFQPARTHHLRFAEMFHIPSLDIHRVFFERPLPDGVTTANVFDGPDEPGCAVHPSPLGHRAYAAAVSEALDGLLQTHVSDFDGPKRTDWFDPYPVNPRFLPAKDLPKGGGWSLAEGTAFAHLPTHICTDTPVLFTEEAGARFVLPVKGSAVFIWGQQHYPGVGNIAGQLSVKVDGVPRALFVDRPDLGPGKQLLQRMMPVARDLDPAVSHVVEVTALAAQDGTPPRIGIHGIGVDLAKGAAASAPPSTASPPAMPTE